MESSSAKPLGSKNEFGNQTAAMFLKQPFSLGVGFAFLLGLLLPCHGEDFKLVPIASYANRPDVIAKEGARAGMILHEHKIECVEAGSAGMTLSVPASRAGEALRLLAFAIKKEGLRITLVMMNTEGTRAVAITPDEVLSWRERK